MQSTAPNRSASAPLRIRRLLPAVALALALFCSQASAGGWVGPGDAGVRHDIQLLIDHGVLPYVNASTWPLPRAVLAGVDEDRLENSPATVRAAWYRLQSRLSLDAQQGGEVRVGAVLGDPERFRPFHASPRENAQVSLGYWQDRDFWSWRLNVTAAADPSDGQRLRLDGSHFTLQLGNWLLSAGALQRWWGPGHDGNVILTNNARPLPGLSVQRASHEPFQHPWLAWIGPWDFSAFLERTDADDSADPANWYLFGMRVTLRPLPGLEIGLSRTAQWGGEGNGRSFRNFLNVVLGINANNPGVQHDNHYAGIDIRYRLPRDIPVAVYTQWIGNDEASFIPYNWVALFGVEAWGELARMGMSYRVYAEYSDTLVDFYRSDVSGDSPRIHPTYRHSRFPSGYRYMGRVLAHSIDSDSLMVSVGGLASFVNDTLHGRLWYADINRTRRLLSTIGLPPAQIVGVDVAWEHRNHDWSIEFGTGLMHTLASDDGRSWDARAHLSFTYSW